LSAGGPAIFLDRDGVLNELVADPQSGQGESPLRVQDVRLVAGAASAASSLREAGYALVCVTNQPAAAKAKTTVSALEAIQHRVGELLRAEGVHIDAWRMCLHHPAGVVAELSGACDCRKPAPGMLLDVASELDIELAASWMVGDSDSDILAGAAAGCRTMLIEHPDSAHKRSGSPSPELVARDLAQAAALLLGSPGLPRPGR
jgi:D-glycero-D-manno-heptose 1,7-bisphosphate phosphatase